MASIEMKTPTDRYKAIADAIRERNGTTELMQPADMPQAILDISGASLKIAYGETPPEDTSKLWVKAKEPENVAYKHIELEHSLSTMNDVSLSIFVHALVQNRNKIYIIGGYFNGGTNAIRVYDTENNTISTLSTTLPYILWDFGYSVVGSKAYIFGGNNGNGLLNSILVFDAETEELTTLSVTLPKVYVMPCCVTVGTKIYIFGGRSDSSSYNSICIFDTETNEINTLAVTLPETISQFSGALVGTKIYLFGGRQSAYSMNPTNTIKVFDIETNEIRTLATTLPETYINSSKAITIGANIYLFGGLKDSYSTNSDTIKVFNADTQTVKTLSVTLPCAICNNDAIAKGNTVYIIGGDEGNICKLVATHELTSGDIIVQSGLYNNKIALSPDIDIGVESVFIGNEYNEAEPVEAYLHNGIEWQKI